MNDAVNIAETLAKAIEVAVSAVLAENQAMMSGFVGMIDYMRIDEEGDTSKYWALCQSEGISNLQYVGMARIIGRQGDLTAEAMLCEDIEED